MGKNEVKVSKFLDTFLVTVYAAILVFSIMIGNFELAGLAFFFLALFYGVRFLESRIKHQNEVINKQAQMIASIVKTDKLSEESKLQIVHMYEDLGSRHMKFSFLPWENGE